MDLPSSLVKKFVEVTKEPESTSTGHYVYGTAIVNGDEKYVQVDGSEGVTSVSIATDIATGDRVLLYIENHTASVIGNVTCPASGRGAIDVSEMLQDFETLVVGDLYAITETVETIYSNYVSTGYLEAYYLTAEYIVGNYLLIENASLTYATIDSLDTEKARITALESSQITTEYLEANYANIIDFNAVKAQIENLDAEYAKIDWVEANYATIQDLDAYYAYIYDLNVSIADIKSLLAGVAGVGDLSAIYLTADNVVIEDALITNAMIANVSADKLTAGTIYTSLIRIQTAEEDESLYIDNSLIQMSEDDLVRLQAGKDATGEYNFYIWNSEGNIMFDATGATADGIGKEVIVNTHVADDANIAGYKLDIASVASYLSEDGSLIVDGEQVVIGGGTLNYILDQINEQIYELQGVSFDGITNITLYFALGTSDTEPPIDNEDTVPALTDVAITDYSFTDVYEEGEGPWSTDEPSQTYGLYKWARYLCNYSDGHIEWSTPFLLTDSYLRQETSTLMTELEIVQGEISAKIWQTDIDEALTTTISNLWTEIDAQLGSITMDIGSVVTNVVDLYEQITTLSLTLEGISADVYNLESTTTDSINIINEQLADFTLTVEDINLGLYNLETNTAESISSLEKQISLIDGIVDYKIYYCLWNSATNAPILPEEIVPALTDVAITDYSFTDVYDSDDYWTEEPLQASYGQYLWILYWLEFQDGHTEWRGPYCQTDEYIREQWATISVQLDSISLAVEYIQDTVDTVIDQWADISVELGDISLEVVYIRDNYATSASLVLQLDSDTGVAILREDANLIELYGNQISIESDYFTLSRTGELVSTLGSIAGWNITARSLWGQFVSVVIQEVEQQAVDDDGNLLYEEEPVLDSDGNPTYTTETQYVYDDDGNIVYDDEGDPETEIVEVPVVEKVPVMEIVEVEVPGSYYENYTSLNIDYDSGDMALVIGSTSLKSNIPDLNTGKIKLYNSGALEVGKITSSGQLSIDYSGGLLAHLKSTGDNNSRIQITSKSGKSVWVGVGTGGINRGLYDVTEGAWMIYKDNKNNISFDSSAIFNQKVDMKNQLVIRSSVRGYSDFIIDSGTSHTRVFKAKNTVGSIQFGISGTGNRGIYRPNAGKWVVRSALDGSNYFGESTNATYIEGSSITTNRPVVCSRNGSTINFGVGAGGSKGLYDGDSGGLGWWAYIDTSNRSNFGSSDFVTILRGSNVYLNGTSTAVTSDRTFKDNITPFEPEMTDALTDKLTPKIYTVASDPETKHIGFIVDEVEDAMRAAGYDPDEYGLTDSYLDEDGNSMGAIRYDEFIPILLYEIQELRDRVNALENPEEGLIDPGIQLN